MYKDGSSLIGTIAGMTWIYAVTNLRKIRHVGRLTTRTNLPGALIGSAISTLILTGCWPTARLPNCVVGKTAPTQEQLKLWQNVPPTKTLDLGVDGSGSMLGLTGSEESMNTWKALLQGVELAAASEGLNLKTKRVGAGKSTLVSSPLKAADPCFFIGCRGFKPITSSLHSFWNKSELSQGQIPIQMVISDLEVNDGDITKLVRAMKPHVEEGAVIAVLSLQHPFQGKVFNSRAKVIHNGEAKRPIFLLATGPQKQLHNLMQTVKNRAALAGVPDTTMNLTYFEDYANGDTLVAKSLGGTGVGGFIPIRLGNTTYNPSQNTDYQFARLFGGAKSIILSSSSSSTSNKWFSNDLGLMQIQAINLPGFEADLGSTSIDGLAINGSNLKAKINLEPTSTALALRASVPRGQLPEPWWLDWDRSSRDTKSPENQTDGLMLLMTSLSKMMVSPDTTPAVSFCLLTRF